MKDNTSTLKAFTTEPKTRRHTKSLSISIERCLYFMEHLWELGLKDCSYETLEFEFIQFFGTNEPRTLKRYLGIPEQVVRYAGSTKIIRMNRMSGKIAQFEYLNEKRIPAKKGLLETLGYITRYKKGNETRFRINHETMPYYTQQTTLNETQNAENNQESKESQETSKLDLCVCSLYNNQHSLKGEAERCGEPAQEEKNGEGSPQHKREEKEEESYRVHTHKSLTSNYEQQLTPEEQLILYATLNTNQHKGEPQHERF